MRRACAQNGKWHHGRAEPQQRAAIFHAERVVRLSQKSGGIFSADGGKRPLLRGGIGDAAFQLLPHRRRKRRRVHFFGGTDDCRRVAAFAAEAEDIHDPRVVQKRRTAAREPFRAGTGPRLRQLQNEIGTARKRHAGAHRLRQQGRFATLGEVTSENNDAVCRSRRTRGGDVMGMSVVERIIFGNNTGNFHGKTALTVEWVLANVKKMVYTTL